jgi:tight adherence protein B
MDNGLLYIIIAATIFAFFQGSFLLVDATGAVQSRIRRRMKDISVTDTAADVLRRRMFGEGVAPWLAAILAWKPVHWLDEIVLTSGVTMRTEHVILAMTSTFPLIVLLLDFVGLNSVLCVIGGFMIAFALPLLLLYSMQKRRLGKIVEQLPETLDILVRSLRAGHPIPTGIHTIATEMPDPIRTEFRLVFDVMTYGLDLRSAFERMEQRVPVPELRYMTAAVRIQYATGGNLAEILASLATVMRERLKLRMKVKALSAEGRLSGRILAAIPFLVTGFITFANPDYYSEAGTNSTLSAMLWGALILVIGGIVMMRRMLNIRV